MRNKAVKTAVMTFVCFGLVWVSGCGLMAGPIVGSALGGSLVGGIIGYQSGEALAGALIGGAITGGLEAAKQSDNIARKQKEKKEQQQITIHIKQEDGSFKPMKFKKTDQSIYSDPEGKTYIRQKDGTLVPVEIKK